MNIWLARASEKFVQTLNAFAIRVPPQDTHAMTNPNNEYTMVEQPFFEQLSTMGWKHLPGDVDVPELTERTSFRETLLLGRLKFALKKLNPWMGESQMSQAVYAITHIAGSKLMERNQAAMMLLVKGVKVDVDPREHDIPTKSVRVFDFDDSSQNDFLAINQFRVDILGSSSRSHCIPDLVLFVNGLPLVVVECKNPASSNPIGAAITDLRKYSNQRDNEEEEGIERLFDFNLFMVATSFYEARSGTIGARPKHFMEWKDTSPTPMSEVAEKLAAHRKTRPSVRSGSATDGQISADADVFTPTDNSLATVADAELKYVTSSGQSVKGRLLSSQQMLIAGMLHPDRILDLLHNFVLFMDESGRTIKVLARYQQYRAVHESIHRLLNKQTRLQHGEEDQRDARQLGFINKSAANLYRDSQLNIADCGEIVRELIDKHLIARGIDPEIEPVDIMDPNFGKEVDKQNSDRAKAAAMEHAVRAHCSKKMDEDPVLYQEFSERINKILAEFAENWAEQKAAFLKCIGDLTAAEKQDVAGLSPGTQVPFFRTLIKHAGLDGKSMDATAIRKVAGMTVDILDHIRQEIRAAGFWQHPNKREVLRSWVEVYLYENDAIQDHDKVPALADQIVDQAKSKHTVLA